MQTFFTEASVCNITNGIKKPIFFLNALDDPISTRNSLVYTFENPKVFLGTTRFGGHVGYHTSLFDMGAWYTKPMLAFFEAYQK